VTRVDAACYVLPMRTLLLTIWTLLAGPGAARLPTAVPVADAIEAASGGDEQIGALLAVYAWRESALQPRAVGDGGRSCGVWQMSCARVQGMPLASQARIWLEDVQRSSLGAVDSSPRRAARRLRLSQELLERARAMVQ